MSRTLVIPDHLYARLAAEARTEGCTSVEHLLQKLAGALSRSPRPGGSPKQERQPSEGSQRVTSVTRIGGALDEFMGDWTEADEKELLDAVAVFEQIDESLWQ